MKQSSGSQQGENTSPDNRTVDEKIDEKSEPTYRKGSDKNDIAESLADAIERGDLKSVRIAINSFDGNLTRMDPDDKALQLAIEMGKSDIAKVLLEAGEWPNTPHGIHRWKKFLYAAIHRQSDVAPYIIKRLSPDTLKNLGKEDRYLLIAATEKYPSIVPALIAAGVPAEERLWLSRLGFERALNEKSSDTKKIILQPASNATTNDGFQLTSLKGLLNLGKDAIALFVESTPKNVLDALYIDDTPLLQWAICNCPMLAEALLRAGIKDRPDEFGCTGLLLAIDLGELAVAKALIASGSNPNIPASGYHKRTALMQGLLKKSPLTIDLINALPDKPDTHADEYGFTPVYVACDRPDLLYLLLSAGLRDSALPSGDTALMHAAESGNLLSLKYLLGHAPDSGTSSGFSNYLNLATRDFGMTALTFACHTGKRKAVELLIRNGADIYQTCAAGSPLAISVRNRNLDIVKLLLAEGAAVGESNPADLVLNAARSGWFEGLEALAGHVHVGRNGQRQLLDLLSHSPSEKLLKISTAFISPDLLTKNQFDRISNLVAAAIAADAPSLLRGILDFIATQNEFPAAFMQIMDELKQTKKSGLQKKLIEFATDRMDLMRKDFSVLRKLIRVAEQMNDYSLVMKIMSLNDPNNTATSRGFSFDPLWFQDPVMLEFIFQAGESTRGNRIDGSSSDKKNFAKNLFKRIKSPSKVRSKEPASQKTSEINGAQLSNDLIIALRSGDTHAVEAVLDDHRLSAVIKQALAYMLNNMVAALYPVASDRPASVCRILVAYAFSKLSEHTRFVSHPAAQLIRSHPQWQPMKQKVSGEIDALEDMAAAILDTVTTEQLGSSLPDLIAHLTIEVRGSATMEADLTELFRAQLGLLDPPARRLAQACVSANKLWRPSSAGPARQAVKPDITASTDPAPSVLKDLIRQQFRALSRANYLPGNFANTSLVIDGDLVDDFNNLVWWQVDVLAMALGIDEPSMDHDDSSSIVSFSDDSLDPRENEKS